MTLKVFVGYDGREHEAWMACRYTIERHKNAVAIPVRHRELRARGLFDRPWRLDEKGQYYDDRDGRPFSTEFSHSRFLVPELARDMKIDDQWVVFSDCDFAFFSPVAEIVKGLDPNKAVYVVKHEFTGGDGVKMDGMVQQAYPRKLWSSLIVWNLKHPKNDFCSTRMVHSATGRDMHAFCWLDDLEIGGLDPRWNWIPGHSDPNQYPFAVHWSFGGPWMAGYEKEAFAKQWRILYLKSLRDQYRKAKVELRD